MLDTLVRNAADLWDGGGETLESLGGWDGNEYLRGQVETIAYAAWDEIPEDFQDADAAKEYVARLIFERVTP